MSERISFKICFALLAAIFLTACNEQSSSQSASGKSAALQQTNYFVKGVVKSVELDEKTVIIKHEAVPNFMPAMTMPFEVKDTNELRGLKEGDAVSFRMIVTEKEGWIDQVTKLNMSPQSTPSRSTMRVVRNVEPLNEGDRLPEYHFTNELGQAVSFSQYKGQAIALTFFFRSCTFPNFCPRMTSNFSEAAKKLSAMTNGPKNWHLFSISFDPENDTPAQLLSYGKFQSYDPKHWSFLTGDLIEIDAITEQFGEQFWHDGNTISHNLRTVVIDTNGRIQKIIPENKWTSDDLVTEMVKAANAKQG